MESSQLSMDCMVAEPFDLPEKLLGTTEFSDDITASALSYHGYIMAVGFKKGELIPAVVKDVKTNEVLMLAYMNKESLAKTLETGYTWFWSRSRQELWNKGATSGHLQKVVSIFGDCDDDTLLVNVEQTGVACHTGNYTCFFNQIF